MSGYTEEAIERYRLTLILAVLQTINQPPSRMMVNRNMILLYQTETHRKMIVLIIQEQSQKQPKMILRQVVGIGFITAGTVQKIRKNQIQSLHYHLQLILARSSINLGVMNARTSLNDTRRKIVLLPLSSRRKIEPRLMQGFKLR